MSMDEITYTHPDYDEHEERWEFYLRSYMGGQDYKDGDYLTRYINEDKDEYSRRISLTPIDNHCRNIVHIYSSYLWRIPPTRTFNSLDGNVALDPFLKDCDLDGRSFNAFMKEANIWASVYGHVWIMLDKPKSNAGTKAEELAQGIRPYATLFTPENIFDWRYERTESGRFKLTYLKVRESVENIDKTSKRAYFRIWTEEEVQIYEVTDEMERLVETLPNPIGRIPAVFLPANRSVVRGIGISDLTDIAYMQQAIYQELSEIEQLIRISNHPTLVKTFGTDASAGAGSVINMPDELDSNLKPYQIQPSGSNLDAVRAAIMDKVESINRMAHMGAVRGTEAQTKSGVALQTEFQLLNARLSEKADILQLAEEQLWELFCIWQGVTPDVEVFYPDSFDLRDYPNELAFLQQARASGVRSNTFLKAVDKLIADLVLDDDELLQAHEEIDSTNQVLGQF
jgi:hypothetical protein